MNLSTSPRDEPEAPPASETTSPAIHAPTVDGAELVEEAEARAGLDPETFFSPLIEAFKEVRSFTARQGDLNRAFLAHLEGHPIAIADEPSARLDPRTVEGLVRKVEETAARQEELNRLFESRLYTDEVQSKALERLHDQLNAYKANFIRQEMQPLLKEVISCHDFVDEELGRIPAHGPAPDPASLVKALEHVKQMVRDVLFKYDIEPYRVEDGGFDRKLQQCVQVVPTDVEADDKKVAALGAVGFRSPEAILRKEQVTVYKYTHAGKG